MSRTRNNHYVPEWYQRGFLSPSENRLHYLNLSPDKKNLSSGETINLRAYQLWPVSKCFRQRDLYTTFFGQYINDEIERKLFGQIDDTGSRAVRAFIGGNFSEYHNRFHDFFSYFDTQKIRTPKGLDWIKSHYPGLNQLQLMLEMQALRNMHCTIWSEGVREIVSAERSNLKFIISDHPVTIYNHACSPDSTYCIYPNDPSIALKGSQTIFPLDRNHCLIITNYEYAKSPNTEDPISPRTNARNFRNTLVRTDAFIRTRSLSEEDVRIINFIIKKRANRYIAAGEKEWLYPEKEVQLPWLMLRETLLPPKDEMFHFGGEVYAGFKDGSTYYQDAFGRTAPDSPYLKKKKKGNPRPNEPCICGSGRKYKKCCRNKNPSQRSATDVLSIRERNLLFCRGVKNILGLSNGKSWDDVRRELSNEQVKKIHEGVGALWPIDTDVISLLPKPDNTLRALYTGLVDPICISNFAISATLHFNEILIQNPFINPATVRPEYSPTHNPHQHKQQTLKNVFLLLLLEPFIEAGFINFIPDPCIFDGHLRTQVFSMAEERTRDNSAFKEEVEKLRRLSRDDIERIQWTLPKEVQTTQIRRAIPDISEEMLARMLNHLDSKKREDPFALLQDDIHRDGQLIIMSMAPNFEMSLFIAQATGSLILTDSLIRWSEITHSQHAEQGVIEYEWHELASHLNALGHYFNHNPETVYLLRASGRLGATRKALASVYTEIQTETETARIEQLTGILKKEINSAFEISQKELKNPKDLDGKQIQVDRQHSFQGKLNYLIPTGGIVHNNVQRLLLSCGLRNYLSNVPMAILMSHGGKY